jgi:hypothetical protein
MGQQMDLEVNINNKFLTKLVIKNATTKAEMASISKLTFIETVRYHKFLLII